MVDTSDVRACICRAQVRESIDPGKAHAGYEKAERMLDRYLLGMGLTRLNTSSDVVQVYLPLYDEIFEGYRRLSETKSLSMTPV